MSACLNVLVTGAAGFIGSHLVDRFLSEGHTVTGIDNLARGSEENLRHAHGRSRFRLLQMDLTDLPSVRKALRGASEVAPYDAVWHMAANSDIHAGVINPDVDFRGTFLTTYNTLTVMRELGIPEIVFASTSAVYGHHSGVLAEDTGPLLPVSNYGAMKLASEASISAAAESHLRRAWIFRFPNVVGPRATHGIIYDLLRKLATGPADLEVLGDGNQQKPYLHVSELVDAMCFITRTGLSGLNCFNIGPADEGATVRYIAETVIRKAAPGLPIRYTGGRQGWVGDVPRFRYSIEKLTKLGWRPALRSEEAIDRAVDEIHSELMARCK